MSNGQEQDKSRQSGAAVPAVSRCLPDGTLIELLYRPEERSTAFAVWHDGAWSIKNGLESDREKLIPFSPQNNLIKNEAVLLPSEPSDYGSADQLRSDVQAFVHRYTDVSPSFEKMATYYILFTWLYDAFNELPYLRLRGDFGTGKTRTLLTMGSLCYKAFFASGASTVSPIFHTLDAFRGTLIFDEADFRFSDERSELVKVLNNGNVRGMPVLRTMMNRQREFNPQAFQVFGPKIVATRSNYEDRGLESRFITEDMIPRPVRPDIPLNLPPSFKEEARQLRNKLLLYRFHHRLSAKINDGLVDPKLEPRLNQILMPLLSIITDEKSRSDLRDVATGAQNNLVAERGLLIEAQVLEILAELMSPSERSVIPIAEITAKLIERYGSEFERPVTNRWVGGTIRKRLGLGAYKSNGVYVVPTAQRGRIEALCARYGVVFDKLDDKLGDVGTTGTFQTKDHS